MNGPSARKAIALGIAPYLDHFAGRHRCETWKQLVRHDPDSWMIEFVRWMDDPDAVVFFNLDGVDVAAGVTRAASGRGGMTDRELLQISLHEVWWPKIQWWREGRVVLNPFETETSDDLSIGPPV